MKRCTIRFPAHCLIKTCDPDRAERLERFLRWPSLKKKWAGRLVQIYSIEHGAYWRRGGAGYTEKLEDAGDWTFENALRLVRHCGPEKGIQLHQYK